MEREFKSLYPKVTTSIISIKHIIENKVSKIEVTESIGNDAIRILTIDLASTVYDTEVFD